MRRAYIDYETFYDNDYSLSKLTPAEYIQDARFEALGAAVAYNDEPAAWLEGADLAAWLRGTTAVPTILFSHNAMFDATITAWRYGLSPLLWGCTLSMARGLLSGHLKRFSLAKVCEHLNLGQKMDTVIHLKGYRLAQLKANAPLYRQAQLYACDDMNKCRGIEQILRPSFPKEEYLVIDTLIRAVTEPGFILDEMMCYQHLAQTRANKQQLLQAVAMDGPAHLMSNSKFADKLAQYGVKPPTKISKTTGQLAFAFAKTDKAMEDLAEHEDPRVQALVAARLGHKSTLEESRTERFISVARHCNTTMPMPLRYSGAHTHRFSGDWKLNVQNLGRNSPLRKALKAPPGYKVVAVDASQIEARLGAWLAGWEWLLQQFRDPTQDPYSNYASLLFGYPVSKALKMERFVGKQSVLSLQYGASWVSFQRMCRTMGGLDLDELTTRKYVKGYRELAEPITKFWRVAGDLIQSMAQGSFAQHKCLFTRKEELRLPSGMALRYPNLTWVKVPPSTDGTQRFSGWRYGDEGINLFGGKLMENMCQALARVIVVDAGTRIALKHKLRYKLQVHDELVWVVPEEQAEWLKATAIAEMSATPNWAPGLPLAAEGGIGDNYGDAK